MVQPNDSGTSVEVTLPAELICAICSWLPFKGRLTASATSKSWREAILYDARLWSSIATTVGSANSAFAIFLERSKRVPVSVQVQVEDQPT